MQDNSDYQMTSNNGLVNNKIREYASESFTMKGHLVHPFFLLCTLFLLTFFLYSFIDFLNLFLHLYPLYTANLPFNNTTISVGIGVADLQFFYNLGNGVLHGSYILITDGQWDGGPLAPFFYAIPVFFSEMFNLDAGYCFREFYLFFLLASGFLLYKIADTFLSPKTSCYLSLSYVYNPFIFIGSVWAGNEEIIATCLFLVVIYFLQTRHYGLSLGSILFASGYKFYAVLFIPMIILFIPNVRTRIITTFILGMLVLTAFLGMIIFYPDYFSRIITFFLQTFPDRGDGLIPFFISWGWLNTSPTTTFIYFLLMFVFLLLLTIYLGQYQDIERFGIILLTFFLLYPQFFLNYLLIPFAFLQFFFFKKRFLWFSYILFSIPAVLSQFAFTQAITIYNMFNIAPNSVLLTFGFINLLIIYGIMVVWIGIYIKDNKAKF